MENNLQSIIPQHSIGSSYRWWVGQVEKKDTKYSNRYKVRIVGRHLKSGDSSVSTDDLPWSHTMLPVTTPYSDGNTTGATANLEVGNWVIGFFLDEDGQRPIIIGSIGHVANSTEEVPPKGNNQEGEKSFQTQVDRDHNPPVNAPADESVNPNKAGHPPGVDERTASALISRLNAENSETNPGGIKFCVEVADPNCGGEKDLGGQLETIIGDMLKANQDSGGQLGDFLVSKATGQLYNYVEGARKYINKAIQVVKTFVARVKGEVVKKIKEGVDELVKTLLKPDVLGDSLKTVREFVNKLLENLGCSISDIATRLSSFLTDLLFDYLYQVFQQAACQVDQLVNGIINELTSLLDRALEKVLGPLSSILGAIAEPINLIGGAINSIFKLLGISCDGPDQKCVKTTKICTDCGANKKKDFLDNLLDNLSNGPLQGDFVCKDANSPIGPRKTNLIFVGGSYRYQYKPETRDSSRSVSENDIVTYTIPRSYRTKEGNTATFTVTRSGNLDQSSSITYRTLNGTAKAGTDYFSSSGTLGFAPGQTERQFTTQILSDNIDEGVEDFFIKFTVATGVYDAYFTNSSTNTQLSTVFIYQDSNSGDGTVGTESDPSITPAIPPGSGPDDDTPDQTETKNPTDPGNNPDFPTDELPVDDDDGGGGGGNNLLPSYAVTANKGSVVEGEEIVYTITTTNVPNGKILNYQLSAASSEDDITASDVEGGLLAGNFIIENNTAQVKIKIAEDKTVELQETIRFSIINTTAFADVLIVSEDTDIDGNGETYKVEANRAVVGEGGRIIYSITTSNVAEGKMLFYTLSGASDTDDITEDDIEGGNLTGSFVIEDSKSEVIVTIAEDSVDESAEVLRFSIDNTNAFAEVTIDPEGSKEDPEPEPEPDPEDDPEPEDPLPPAPRTTRSLTLEVDKTVVKEGEFVKFTIRTQNVEKGTRYGYTIFGDNITRSDFVESELTGIFTMDDVDNDTTVNPTNSDNFLVRTITIGIADDGVIENDEVFVFAVNGTGQTVAVLIDSDSDIDLDDPGDGGGGGGGTIIINDGDPTNRSTTRRKEKKFSGFVMPTFPSNLITIPIDFGGTPLTTGGTGGTPIVVGGSGGTPLVSGGTPVVAGGSGGFPIISSTGRPLVVNGDLVNLGGSGGKVVFVGGSGGTPVSDGDNNVTVGGDGGDPIVVKPDPDGEADPFVPTIVEDVFPGNNPSDPLDDDPSQSDSGVINVDQPSFQEPVAGTPFTDDGGSIIDFPIIDGGGPYVEAPTVLISGQGYGASGIALLDDKGSVSEIRITNPGRGYVINKANNSGRSCVIDSYTMIRPGQGYTEKPRVFVNGEEGIAEAVIANNRVISLKIVDRTKVFESYPQVEIIGGNGFGALFIPSFVCLDIEGLERSEYAKIGTGKYIDCP
jgi:hypothetical protein